MGEMARITLEDVLDVKYLGKWAWSPCGRWIAWIHDAGGVNDLWLGEPSTGKSVKLTSATDGVWDFAWRPGEAARLALVVDGGLFMAEPENEGAGGFVLRRLVGRKDQHGSLAWSPDGQALAYGCAGSAWLDRPEQGEHVELKLPGRLIPAGYGGTPLGWSTDGKMLACGAVGEDHVPQVVVLGSGGGQLWGTLGTDPVGGAAWVDEGTLLYRVLRNMGGDVDFYLVSFPPTQAEQGVPAWPPHVRRICEASGDGRGPALLGTAAPSPDGTQILLLLENNGYAHYYRYSLETGALEQVTFGECEDLGHAGDEAAWTPDGSQVVFASNRGDLGCRHLWLLKVSTGDLSQLTFGRVTDVQPKPSPDGRWLAYVHCDEYRNMDIWVAPFDRARLGRPRQLSCSMPAAWTPDSQVVPEEVTYQGAEGWTIHAQLYLPRGCSSDGSGKHPGLVWVHGGPIRQLRPGWHPMRSYALFHAYHQYLLQKGYVVLMVNYRGGIGYGREFRHGLYHKMGVNDVLDVVEGGRFLRRLPCTDPARVAVWGLSYGGYMTLHALTQYPEEFAMGVNVAGIWDFGQWDRWMESRGRRPTWSRWYLGGRPEEAPELYRQGSPCSFKDRLVRPLINVQGTQDANVDFAQLDRIVQDCVGLGKYYEAYYYPQEVHTFRHKRSWKDAFPKIEREFEKWLSPMEG